MRKLFGVFGVMLALTLVLSVTFVPGMAVAKKLKVAAIYTTPIEEPWDGAVHKGLLKGKKMFGYQYEYTEKVAPPDFAHVMRDYATRGYNIIFADAFATEQQARDVAKDFPKVKFVLGSGLGPVDPNVSVFDDWIHEPAYICGMIAGKITKTNILGVVGGYPIPEVNRLINAFIFGAKKVNKKIKVKVTFIGSWFDPPKAKEAALAQIDAGADVLYAERYGVIDACKEKHVLAFGNLLDQHVLGPNTVITSPVWDFFPTVKFVVTSVMADKWVAMDLREWSMMAKGGAKLAPFYNFTSKLPVSVLKMVERTKKAIIEGKLKVPVDESEPKSD